VALARHLLAKGERNKALAAARDAVNTQPDNPDALDLLGSIQLALGDTANAMGTFSKLVEKQPDSRIAQVKLATAQIAAKDPAKGRKTLQDVLRAQPDFLEAQLLLGNLDIQEARFDDAQKIALQIQQKQPASPAGYALAGDSAFARKDFAAALAAFEQAHQRAPSSLYMLRQMQALRAANRQEEGEKRLLAWLGTHPQDISIRATLAESLIGRGQHKAAAEQYLILNQSAPNNLVVLNNLAWALFESGDPRALAIAEQAYKLKPDSPAVIDTLGWILVSQGQAARGIKLLQQALSRAPDAAEIQFHLAASFARSGDAQRAQSELKRLLARGTAFPQEQEARALLQKLQTPSR
jgi:putative PEP-CTERM system TPR-repeat lipoprotein